jgi:GPI mannosyltransferase 4
MDWYMLLVAARLAAAVVLPGYVHADEFFQSPEELAGAVLGAEINQAWEYDPAGHPARCVVPPALVSGVPLALLAWALPPAAITARALLVGPRLAAALLSLGLDVALARLCRRMGVDPAVPLLWLATSAVTLVLHTRPFSNATEAVVLAAALALALTVPPSVPAAAGLGALGTLGVFVRITFPAFALPLGPLLLLLLLWQRGPAQGQQRQGRWGWLASVVAAGVAGAGAAALVLASMDALYFGTARVHWDRVALWLTGAVPGAALLPLAEGRLVWTPWNNAKYNLDPANLSTHTTHPRWLHALINLPALYGPLVPLAALALRPRARPTLPAAVAAACAVSGLAILSLVPHQEPRFLVPLLLPLLVAAAPRLRVRGSAWVLWILGNAVVGLGYGVLHQGGVLPSLLYVDTALRTPSASSSPWRPCEPLGAVCPLHIIYAHTYMPPHYLLLRNHTTLAPATRPDLAVHVHDVSGDGGAAVAAELDSACAKAADPTLLRAVVVAPAHRLADPPAFLRAPRGVGPPLATFGPHLSMEELAAYAAAPLAWRTWHLALVPVLAPCPARMYMEAGPVQSSSENH